MEYMRNKSGRFVKGHKQGTGPDNPGWKGGVAFYCTRHEMIYKLFGQPKKCEDCGSTEAKKFEWANLSGEYKIERSDWRRLCTTCHHRLDKIAEKAWKTKRKNLISEEDVKKLSENMRKAVRIRWNKFYEAKSKAIV